MTSAPNFFTKEWDPVFSTNRDYKREIPWVELKRHINATGEDVGIFLEDFEVSVPSCKAEEVKEFCKGAHLADLESANGTAGQRRGAWLDDMASSHVQLSIDQAVRKYPNPLTATGLYRSLKLPVNVNLSRRSETD